MLSRFLIPPLKTTSHHLRFLTTLISSNKYLPPPPNPIHSFHVSQTRFFSSNTSGGKDDNPWKITDEDDIFKDFSNDIASSRANVGNVESWDVSNESKTGGDVFGDIDKEVESRKSRRTNVGNVESWDVTSNNELKTGGDVFGDVDKEFESMEKLGGIGSRRSNVGNVESWNTNEMKGDVFGDIDKESGGGGEEEWENAQGMKGWSIGDDDKVNDIFSIGGEEGGIEDLSSQVEDLNAKNEVQQQLEMEKKQLLLQLKGPNRAFGDLIAAAGITDAMLDSLIALKDLEAVEGLSPLSEIEDTNSEKSQKSYTRAEIERRKQEEIDKSRVRRVDEKGRAYGTGRRKCSVARVWIEPGEGKFLVNDKQFDVYFPIIDHRADLLRPFCETKTLGLWDVKCTVKGGGISGQVGAVRLGISRALQNWEPGLRSDLKAVGFLTRDPRMVERKKPGKAKARKSFQWVKR